MSRPATGAERILALIEGAAAEATLEAAAELAAAHRLPLVGLVVEDARLLSSAGLPFAREIGLVSGVPRPLSTADVEARMHEQSERLRGRLGDLARRHGIVAELEVGRGPRVQTVLARLQPEDTLVVRRSGALERPFALFEGVLAAAQCAVLVTGARPGPPLAGDGAPMVLVEDERSAERVVSRAARLARGRFRGLVLLLAPTPRVVAAGRRLASRLADEGLAADTIELARLDAAAVLRAVRRERPALLCLARDSAILAGGEGERLAENEDVLLAVVP